MNFINENENKTIKLFEKQGVAAFRYNNVIKEIVNFIKKQFSKTKSSNIIVPQHISNKIDMLENPKIIVNIVNNYDADFLSGSGTTILNNSKLNLNNKLENITIKITAYSYNDILYIRTLTNSLYHELNHCYEFYKRLINGEDYYEFPQKLFTNNHYKYLELSSNKITNYIKLVLYRLFFKTEYNALISSVYPDLLEYGTNKNNYREDLKNVQAFIIYEKIKNNIHILDDLTEDDWNDLMFFCNNEEATNNSFGDFYIRAKSVTSFKNKFKKTIKYKLVNMFKDIMHTAFLFYELDDIKKEHNFIKKMHEALISGKIRT